MGVAVMTSSGLLPRRGGHGPGQQRDLHGVRAEAAEQPVAGERAKGSADRVVVLGGEDFGGGQQRGLAAGVDHLQHGTQRHDGLA
jgi:hypothetical protein